MTKLETGVAIHPIDPKQEYWTDNNTKSHNLFWQILIRPLHQFPPQNGEELWQLIT